MKNIVDSIHNVRDMDRTAAESKWLQQVHPLSKMLITILYIFLVISFHKYDLSGLCGMSLYLIAVMTIGELSIGKSLKKIWIALLFVGALGIVNPFFDRTIVCYIGSVGIRGGVISMMTVLIKGVFTVIATYILMVTTSMESICSALRMLKVPAIIVTLILLMHRYITMMLKEVERIMIAYSLRDPKHKGVHYKAWGTLVGQILLRSIDRAEDVYESMVLRGFSGTYYLEKKYRFDVKSIFFLVFWVVILVLLRAIPLFEIVGRIFV